MATKIGETTVELSLTVRNLSERIAIDSGDSFDATWRRVVAVLDISEDERLRLHDALLGFADSV